MAVCPEITQNICMLSVGRTYDLRILKLAVHKQITGPSDLNIILPSIPASSKW